MHYYQRWAENDKAKAQARRLAQHAAEGQLHRLSELTATPTSQLKFISDAWDQVRHPGNGARMILVFIMEIFYYQPACAAFQVLKIIGAEDLLHYPPVMVSKLMFLLLGRRCPGLALLQHFMKL